MKIRTISYPIDSQHASLSAERFLRDEGFSHSILVDLKRQEGAILLNGRPIPAKTLMPEGSLLTIHITDSAASSSIDPVPMDLSIVYEDEDLMILNKPAGLPVHPSMGHRDDTLANGLSWYFKEKGEDFAFRAISRLDRDTTGLLIIAKNNASACLLSRQVSHQLIEKEYLAAASGCIPESGTIDAPIRRADDSVIERMVDLSCGDPARTHYERLFYDPVSDLSLARIRLETGRTHQIRVHFLHIGHTLTGDFLYNPDFSRISRQALHSWKLRFLHPITKAPMQFTAPMPDDMIALFPSYSEAHLNPFG